MRISRQGVEFGGGFAFVCFVAVVLTFVYWFAKVRPEFLRSDQVSRLLSRTEEERTLRNLQDPLAMRLYVLSNTFIGDPSGRQKIMEQVIEQWKQEVSSLGKDAYHTSAASLSLDSLGLTPEERQKVESAMKSVEAAEQRNPAAAW